MELNLSALKILRVLLFITGLLIVVHLIGQWFAVGLEHGSYEWRLTERINMDTEESIPTWFAQILLFIAAALLFLIAFIQKRLPKGRDSRFWAALGVIFVYVSMDEGAGLHEMTVRPMKDLFGIEQGIFYFAWVIPVLGLLALAGVIFFKFWLRLPTRTRWLFLASLIVFVSGAAGVEMYTAHYLSTGGERGFYYAILVAIEEGLEKAGAALFIYSLLDYLRSLPKKDIPGIRFKP